MSNITKQEKEILEKLEAQHGKGRVKALRASNGAFVCYRGCEPAERNRWCQQKEKSGLGLANDNLAKSVTVHPVDDARVALYEQLPFLSEMVADRSQKLSGGVVEDLGNE